ncbi:MAG: glycosyltransferase, partial [Bacteroidales bacterium]|nr:glycosyltransferase [Bacteroidales bacterium]
YNSSAHSRIHSLIQRVQPDMLYGQLVRVAPYLQDESCKKTIDYQDTLSVGMKRREEKASWVKRWIFHMEFRRLQRYERCIMDTFDVKTIISDSDRQCIDHSRKNDILVVPNGVDFEHFTKKNVAKKYDVVFTGNMAYPPNVDAVAFLSREIMPIVWKTRPETTLCIAGATPAPSVKSAANEKITVTGWVDDMRDVYVQSHIFIAPMRIGTGLQNKLLEAMSMELPCITSPLANGSLRAENGTEICVADSAETYARAILNLLNDEQMAEQMAHNGNAFVHAHFDWNATTEIVEKAMEKIL